MKTTKKENSVFYNKIEVTSLIFSVFLAFLLLFLVLFLTIHIKYNFVNSKDNFVKFIDLFAFLSLPLLILFLFFCYNSLKKKFFILGSNYFVYANDKVLFKDLTDVYFWITRSYSRHRDTFTHYHFTFYVNNRQIIHLAGLSEKSSYILLNELKKYLDIKEEEPLAKTTKELQFFKQYGEDTFKKRQKKIEIQAFIFTLFLYIFLSFCEMLFN